MNLGFTESSLTSLPPMSSHKPAPTSHHNLKRSNLLPKPVIEQFAKAFIDDWIIKAIDLAEIHDFTVQTFQYHFDGAAAIGELVFDSPHVHGPPDMLEVEPLTISFENWNRNSVFVVQKTSAKASTSFQDVSLISLTQKSKGLSANTLRNPNQPPNGSTKKTLKENINEESSLYSKSRRSSFNPLIGSKETNATANNRKQPSIVKLLPPQSSLSLNGKLNEDDLRSKKIAEIFRLEKKELRIRPKLVKEILEPPKAAKEKSDAFQVKRDILTYTLTGEPLMIKQSKSDNIKSLIQHPK
jgi:hypothetical protein